MFYLDPDSRKAFTADARTMLRIAMIDRHDGTP